MTELPNKQRKIAPATIRYIKLGPGGAWEAASLDGGRIEWSNSEDRMTSRLRVTGPARDRRISI